MITDSFDTETRPLLTLKDFYGEKRYFADICLVTFSKVIYETLLTTYSCKKVADMQSPNGDTPIYSFQYEGHEILFYLSLVGSTGASHCVMEANWLTGATKFVMFGSSGSLDQETTANRFVIPTEAYRDEGTSYHYASPADYIIVKNSSVVSGILKELHIPFVEGRIWTTDAIMRETVGNAAKRRAEGCIAVDMEIAGVQSVCDFHGLELYAFVVTGDVLSEDSYTIGTLSDANHNVDKLQIALEIAVRI